MLLQTQDRVVSLDNRTKHHQLQIVQLQTSPMKAIHYDFIFWGTTKSKFSWTANVFLQLWFYGPKTNILQSLIRQTLDHLRSAGSTLRSRQRPLGRPDSDCVRLGNLLCCRALLLLCLCASKGVWWILEQPMSSCMEYHPLFQRVIRMLGMRKILVSMANYGGPTEKKTYLYSSILIVKKHPFYCLKVAVWLMDWVPLLGLVFSGLMDWGPLCI